MATLRTIIAPSPAQMLVRAAEGLFPLAIPSADKPWPTLPAWVVLRQGGLRDDFHALAARDGVAGWFDPTVVVLSELADRWGERSRVPLSDAERFVLLRGVIGRVGADMFGSGDAADQWVPHLDALLGEIMAEGVTADALRVACAAVPGRTPFAVRRDAALSNVLEEWMATLTRSGRTDDRARVVELAQAIVRDPSGFETRLGGRRDVRFVGLSSLRGGYGALLRALCDSPALDAVTLIVSHPLSLPEGLQVTVERDAANDGAAAWLAQRLFAPEVRDVESAVPAAVMSGALHLVEAPDAAREAKMIAVRVRALVDAGTEPSRIAVVFRNERPGVDVVATTLRTVGVPVTARLRIGLRATAPARALRALLTAQVHGWSLDSVLEIVSSPLLRTKLRPQILAVAAQLTAIRGLHEWLPALEDLVARCRKRDETPDTTSHAQHRLPRTRAVERCLDAWHAWLPIADSLDRRRTSAEWFRWVGHTLVDPALGIPRRLAWPVADDADVSGVERRAYAMLLEKAEAWASAFEAYGGADTLVSASGFLPQFDQLLDADVLHDTRTDFGVVVGEAMAMAWRAFDHVFVAGLQSDAFPLPSPVSPILRDEDRVALIAAGLPLDDPVAWPEREQELFRALCAAPRRSLTLSWSGSDGAGHEVLRSRFVDEVVDCLCPGADKPEQALMEAKVFTHMATQQVVIPGYPLITGTDAASTAMHAAVVSAREQRRTRAADPWNGLIEDEALRQSFSVAYGESFVWSPTQLEEMAKCPWSWFASRQLRLTEEDEAEDGITHALAGTVRHDALDRFFAAARAQRGVEAVYLRPEDSSWVLPLAKEAVAEAWEAAARHVWMGDPAMHDLVRAELQETIDGYLQFEMQFNDKSADGRTNAGKQLRTGALAGELKFDGITVTVGDTSFRLRGSVDRVDRCVDDRFPDAGNFIAAIDYKSSRYATPGGGEKKAWKDGVVLQIPLYAAVLQQLYPEARLSHIEYRTLRSPAVVHQLKFVKVSAEKGKKGKSVTTQEGSEVEMELALQSAARKVELARAAMLPTMPTASCGCSPYCAARDVCRIPGGPVSTGFTR